MKCEHGHCTADATVDVFDGNGDRVPMCATHGAEWDSAAEAHRAAPDVVAMEKLRSIARRTHAPRSIAVAGVDAFVGVIVTEPGDQGDATLVLMTAEEARLVGEQFLGIARLVRGSAT